MSKKLWEFISLRRFLFIAGEGLCIFGSVILATYLLWESPFLDLMRADVLLRALMIMLVVQISLYFHDLYEIRPGEDLFEIARRVGYSFGIGCIVISVLYYFFPPLVLGRGVVILSLVLLAILITSWRLFYQLWIQKKFLAERTLILGVGKLSHDIADEIGLRPELCQEVVAIACARGNVAVPEEFRGAEIKEGFDGLYEFCLSRRISKVIVAFDERRGKLPVGELLRCKVNGLEVMEGETFFEDITGKLIVERINPSWLIFSEGFQISLVKRVGKRALDFMCAIVGLVLNLPILLIAAVIIKLESKGPVFFKQERLGRGEKPFTLYKFRSMRQDAEARTGPVWAQAEDPRITNFGRIIRKTRIDELPQLWNVLKGEMSIVGPRPERQFFVKQLEEKIPYYSQRFAVKPGLTGWAQILYGYGATEADAAEKLRFELFYIKNMSLAMDVLIILATFKIVYLRKGH